MNIKRATPFNESLAKLFFLILPTALVGYLMLPGWTTVMASPREVSKACGL